MIILALDTCFARCAACLYDSAAGRVLAEEALAMERGHAEALAPLIERLMAAAGLGPKQIDRVAVTTGPGTFTGLRIGLSFARAFGLARKVPVIGCDSLQAVAISVTPEEGQWLVAHKAGQSGFHYLLRPGAEPVLLSHELLVLELAHWSGLVLGTAAEEICDIALHVGLRRDPARDLPQLEKLSAHAATVAAPATMPEPVYLREADAKPQPPTPGPLRKAETVDLPAMASLHKAIFGKAWPENELAAMLAVPGTEALVYAATAGPLAGFTIIRAVAGEAEILTLAVSPALRRRGIGRALLQAACHRLGQAGTARLLLEVNESNDAARALYAECGFVEQGRRKAYYETTAGRQDAIIMARGLP